MQEKKVDLCKNNRYDSKSPISNRNIDMNLNLNATPIKSGK
jgi:hypothetical protein